MKSKHFLKISIALAMFIAFCNATAQQGTAINSSGAAADASAILDVSSTTQGLLIPRMTETDRVTIASPATGLMVYQTDVVKGFYYHNGTAWTYIGADNLGNHTATDSLDMANYKIKNLATCTQNYDAANKEYVDGKVGAGGGGGGALADTTFQFSRIRMLPITYNSGSGTTFTVPADKGWSVESALNGSGVSLNAYPLRIINYNGNNIAGYSSVVSYVYAGNALYPPVFPLWLEPGNTITFEVGNSAGHKGWISVREYKMVVQ